MVKKKKLLIVESPNKIKTLKKILGKDFEVKASVGHVIDLPQTKLGVDLKNDYEPQYTYIRGKKKIIQDLIKCAASCDEVLLGPDPDREGEAISWHLARELGIPETKACRVTFNAITEKVVNEALNNVKPIDINKVNAQQGRRVLDRLMGYLVSPILWVKLMRGLSAGRVQSVALFFLVKREDEIFAFKPEEFWKIIGYFDSGNGKVVQAEMTHYQGNKVKLDNKADVDKVIKGIVDSRAYVSNISSTVARRKAPLPFKTSTLQQEAYSRLGFSPRKTMSVAQKLYEGVELGNQGSVALITYMRSDSVRIDEEAEAGIRNFVSKTYGKEYLTTSGSQQNKKKAAVKVQDAHEAIRPINVETLPDDIASYLTGDMLKLYDLIWRRTVGSFMSDTEIQRFTVKIRQGEGEFKLVSETISFQGFNKVYANISVKDVPGAENLTVDQELTTEKFDELQNFTQPKPRYSEASLIKELEEKGIGRPSTYASIVGTLYERSYASRFEKKMRPTDLGIIVSKMLETNFIDIINEDFTAHMEEDLDLIEKGDMDWKAAIDEFYQKLSMIIKQAEKDIPRILIKTDHPCDKCGKELTLKFATTGKFLACSGYPRCKNTVALPEEDLFLVGINDFDSEIVKVSEKLSNTSQQVVADTENDQLCEECGQKMVLKNGRFGAFMACISYPKCKNTKPIPKSLGMECPKDGCEGEVVVRKTKKGKRFYGCSKYPDCDYVSWTKPQNKQ